MPNVAQDWMIAARCHEVPRPEARFSALPARYQRDVVCMGLMALGTIVFAAGAVCLALPLPSRTLASAAPLPHGPARPERLQARPVSVLPPISAGPPRQLPASRPSLDLASAREVPGDPVSSDDETPQPRRRNILSRFFRGVWRGVQPSA